MSLNLRTRNRLLPAVSAWAGLLWCLLTLLGTLFGAPHAVRADDAAETAAKTCLEGTGELLPQHHFAEAADKYVCAADALAKVPGQEERAARYRANAWLYRSWGTYTQKPITGPLGRENLEDAIRQVQQSQPLWQEAHFPVGERLAEAWLLYLSGVKLSAAGQYASARDNFNKAREMFTRISEDVPNVRELTDMLLGLAEDQTVFTEVISAMNDPASFETQGGYINTRLQDMQRRAAPETRPYYESLAGEFRVERQFFEAGDRLEAWDYQDADAVLAQAKKTLDTALPGAEAVPVEQTRANYRALLDGWNGIVDAERHHAAALKSLLADGDTAKAKGELLQGVAAYRRAQESFETAGYPSGSIAAIEKSYAQLRERAAVVAQAFGPTQAVLGIGRTFFLFFFVTLGGLTALRSRLRLRPAMTLWAALVVAIISAFSLRSVELLQVLNLGEVLKLGETPAHPHTTGPHLSP